MRTKAAARSAEEAGVAAVGGVARNLEEKEVGRRAVRRRVAAAEVCMMMARVGRLAGGCCCLVSAAELHTAQAARKRRSLGRFPVKSTVCTKKRDLGRNRKASVLGNDKPEQWKKASPLCRLWLLLL